RVPDSTSSVLTAHSLTAPRGACAQRRQLAHLLWITLEISVRLRTDARARSSRCAIGWRAAAGSLSGPSESDAVVSATLRVRSARVRCSSRGALPDKYRRGLKNKSSGLRDRPPAKRRGPTGPGRLFRKRSKLLVPSAARLRARHDH